MSTPTPIITPPKKPQKTTPASPATDKPKSRQPR